MRKPRRQPRVYAFIDSQNLNVGTQRLGWKMDWKKFRRFLADNYGASQAFMFIGYIPEQEKMYQQLHEAGYSVVPKPTFDMTKPRPEEKDDKAEEDKKPIKGNIDADLVLWCLKEAKNYEKAIIVSGDGDFYSLVEYLVANGRLAKLLTPSGHYSSLFNKFDDHIVRLDQFRRQLAYRDRASRRSPQKEHKTE
jgi:uncharacterized LabA/DUF88 family protein